MTARPYVCARCGKPAEEGRWVDALWDDLRPLVGEGGKVPICTDCARELAEFLEGDREARP